MSKSNMASNACSLLPDSGTSTAATCLSSHSGLCLVSEHDNFSTWAFPYAILFGAQFLLFFTRLAPISLKLSPGWGQEDLAQASITRL